MADAVREVVGAQAAVVSRVVDDDWFEVVVVSGALDGPDATGSRWRRTDLDRHLAGAERRGHLHATTQQALYDVTEAPGAATGDASILFAPLETDGGELVGVLATVGDVEGGRLTPEASATVGLYAEQARLALELMREQHLLLEQGETVRRSRHLVAELRERDQDRRDLVASLTHDLKTPLTAIALNAELLASDCRRSDADAWPVAAIRRSTERLSGLVDDLLALARVEEGPGPTNGAGDQTAEVDPRERTDAVALVRDACRHAEVEARRRGLRFVLDLPELLPVAADGPALARVYGNVVDNAVKFSLPDGEVRITLQEVSGQVEMRCADDGVGISEADQATVFDMFRRARQAPGTGVPGSGVGLSISHRIVTRLGGSIDVASAPGQGSTFVVRVASAG